MVVVFVLYERERACEVVGVLDARRSHGESMRDATEEVDSTNRFAIDVNDSKAIDVDDSEEKHNSVGGNYQYRI